jgi:uncharacterized protein YbjT (DUF2867 family)
MKVAIAGGHGKIALHLTRLLHERGDQVVSIIRKPEQSESIAEAGGEPLIFDLEAGETAELARQLDGVDAVVFAAGAGPGSGPERKWTVDFGGAVKLIHAAQLNKISRYVMVSATGANSNAPGNDTFAVYLQAKGKADEELINSGLDYTITRPHLLTDDAGDGLVRIAGDMQRGKVSRENVAAVIAAALQEPQTIKKTFELTDGNDPIDEALRNFA